MAFLERDLNIVTVSAVHGFGNRFPFPRGPLREPMWGLKRADLVVLYQCSECSESYIDELKTLINEETGDVPIIGVDIVPQNLRKLTTLVASPGTSLVNALEECGTLLDGLSVFAFSGLGSPESFVATLTGCKAIVSDSLSFSDHYKYQMADINTIIKRALDCSASAIVTTEKDEANLVRTGVRELIAESPVPFYVLPVEGKLVASDEDILMEVLRGVL